MNNKRAKWSKWEFMIGRVVVTSNPLYGWHFWIAAGTVAFFRIYIYTINKESKCGK